MTTGTYSGHVGVGHPKNSRRWQAQLWREGGNLYLGTYDTQAEAIAARRAAELTYNAFRRTT